MAAVSTATASLLNRMNRIAKKVGLGTILSGQSHKVIAAGTQTTPGGSATVDITVTGATTSDVAIVVLKTVGATPRTITTVTAIADKIRVVMSGDPSTDHVLSYVLHRAL